MDLHEKWAAGDAYEQFMGRWSAQGAVSVCPMAGGKARAKLAGY